MISAVFAMNLQIHSKELCSVPIDIHNEHVYVPVEYGGGNHLSFLLDSGAAASLNILDRTRASKLGIVVEGSGNASAIGGTTKIAFANSVDLAIRGLHLKPQRVAIMDLANGQASEGHAVDGLIGYSLFQDFVVQIDYPGKKLRLFAFGDRRVPLGDRSTVRLPLRIWNKNCIVSGTVRLGSNSKAVRIALVVDTGFDGTIMLTRPFAKKNGLLTGIENKGSGLGGKITTKNVTISDLSLGQALHIRSIPARASDDAVGAFNSSDVDGYIGGGVLQNYVVTFDYKHGELLLTPGNSGPRGRDDHGIHPSKG